MVLRRGPRLTRRRLAQLAAAAGAAAALPGRRPPRRRPLAAAPPTRNYDDGSDAIPSAVPGAGNPGRVIVIGAGWSGLTAANALRNAGVDVVVLEARRRLGGRAWTRRVGGHPVDLGCSWIHDPIGNPMADFAARPGSAPRSRRPRLDIATIRFFDQVERRRGCCRATSSAPSSTRSASTTPSGDYATRLGPDASVRDAAARLPRRPEACTATRRRRAEFAIRLFSEQEENMYWNRISLPYVASYEAPYDGVGQGNFPTGGYRKLIEAMAGDTEVRFGHRGPHDPPRPRRRPRRGQRTAAPASASACAAATCSCTVSLGVLKHHGVEFAPRLPKAKRAVIRRLGFGYFEKVALAFDEPFWQEGAHTHIVRLAKPFGFPMTLDLQQFSGFPVLERALRRPPRAAAAERFARAQDEARPRRDRRGDRPQDPRARRRLRDGLAPRPVRARRLLDGDRRPAQVRTAKRSGGPSAGCSSPARRPTRSATATPTAP